MAGVSLCLKGVLQLPNWPRSLALQQWKGSTRVPRKVERHQSEKSHRAAAQRTPHWSHRAHSTLIKFARPWIRMMVFVSAGSWKIIRPSAPVNFNLQAKIDPGTNSDGGTKFNLKLANYTGKDVTVKINYANAGWNIKSKKLEPHKGLVCFKNENLPLRAFCSACTHELLFADCVWCVHAHESSVSSPPDSYLHAHWYFFQSCNAFISIWSTNSMLAVGVPRNN